MIKMIPIKEINKYYAVIFLNHVHGWLLYKSENPIDLIQTLDSTLILEISTAFEQLCNASDDRIDHWSK